MSKVGKQSFFSEPQAKKIEAHCAYGNKPLDPQIGVKLADLNSTSVVQYDIML